MRVSELRAGDPPGQRPGQAAPPAWRNPGRGGPWLVCALGLIALPWLFDSGYAITLLAQMGVMIIFALSWNLLFGLAGMLSFGHAVYAGLGAYLAVHVLNFARAEGGAWATPWTIVLLPLVGGLGAAGAGLVLGFLTTRRAGTPFAMITLGLGELVFAVALMWPELFGGEAGVSTDRVLGPPAALISFGPAIQVYYLIAGWCLVCSAAMYAFTRTPLGQLAQAVRDNAERAEFIGYSARQVRFRVVVAAAFFAGVSGTLAAIQFEIVTADNLSTLRSGAVLLAAVIGGTAAFFGPVLGAIVFVFFSVALAEYTPAWPLHLGLFFIALVLFAPGGLAGLLQAGARRLRPPSLPLRGLATLLALSILTTGLVFLIELCYVLSHASAPAVPLFDPGRTSNWLLALLLSLAGGWGLHALRSRVAALEGDR